MSCSCERKKSKDYQEFDENYFPPKIIENLLDKNNPVYYYIIRSVGYRDHKLVNTGCAPNFQGGIVTLCTCKHYMRTYNLIQDGCWIAGFTSIDVYPMIRGNFLYYLARIKRVINSQSDLWNSDFISEKAKNKKNTYINPFGDLYEPLKNNLTDRQKFDPLNYHIPCKDHSHYERNEWHYDILKRYKRKNSVDRKISKLIVFDPKYSYVWTQPMYKLIKQFTRGVKPAFNLEDLRKNHIVEI